MALRKPLFFNAAEFGPEEMASADSIELGALTMSGDITMAGNEVVGLPAVPSATAAASKEYVDATIQGLNPQPACRLATTAALVNNGWTPSGSGVGKTLTSPSTATSNNDFDSTTAALNDRILVKDEIAADYEHNGIYVVTQLADGVTDSTILTRATDFDEDSEVTAGSHTFVNEGTVNADTGWLLISDDPLTVDTSDLQWSQFSSGTVFSGGQGIDITAGVISVDLATNPGLQFIGGAPNGQLSLLVAANQGLALTASGLETVLAAAGALSKGAGGLSVNVDGASMFVNGSNQLEARIAILQEDVTANENVALGDPIEWSGTNNEIRQCRANSAPRVDCFGVVTESGGISASGSGRIVRRGTAAGVLVGATAGDRYYVGDTGGLVQGIGSISAGNHVVFVGTARNATDLEVNPQYITKKAA